MCWMADVQGKYLFCNFVMFAFLHYFIHIVLGSMLVCFVFSVFIQYSCFLYTV
jgi:hypothetical protein